MGLGRKTCRREPVLHETLPELSLKEAAPARPGPGRAGGARISESRR